MNTPNASRNEHSNAHSRRNVHRPSDSRAPHLPSRQYWRQIPSRNLMFPFLTLLICQPLQQGIGETYVDTTIQKSDRGGYALLVPQYPFDGACGR